MKIIKTEIVTKEIISLEDILCNKCGSSCMGPLNFLGLIEQSISGAYDSTHLSDATSYTFSLCEKCLMELFHTFKIPVETSEHLS